MKDDDRYYSYARYLRQTGHPQMHVVPLDLGLGCPNRDGDGRGGCTFCPEHGARARQTAQSTTLEQQVADAITFAKHRYGAKRFMAYVQAFTGTFAAANEQRELYERVLGLFPFAALSIGTRPDCLSEDTVDFLREIGRRLDVRVELGIQTTHDRTLDRITRGHSWECGVQAIYRLHDAGIPVIVHVILGLPGEDQDDFNVTAERLAKLPLAGIKIHNLHVMKGTTLADEYRDKPFPVMNEFEYLDALIEFLRRLPADLPVLRVTTDTPVDELIAPRWSMSKGRFVEALERHLAFRLYRQGDLREPGMIEPLPCAESITTDDGSITFWSPVFKEHYHTTVGAVGEATRKYVEPSRLQARLNEGPVRLLDVCFGLGYNTLAACELAHERAENRLEVTALEIDRAVVGGAADHADDEWRSSILKSVFADARHSDDWTSISMFWGDARHTIGKAAANGPFDMVYLDAFSTQKNSELWTVEFFEKLRDVMTDDAVLLTYCASLPVRAGLMVAGFFVGNTPPYGRARPGTIATKRATLIDSPLDDQELVNIRTTTKGIPFRDPDGTATSRDVLKRREERVKAFKISHDHGRQE